MGKEFSVHMYTFFSASLPIQCYVLKELLAYIAEIEAGFFRVLVT